MPVRAMGATGTIGEAHNSEANKCRSTLELSCIMLAMLCLAWNGKLLRVQLKQKKDTTLHTRTVEAETQAIRVGKA